MRDEALVTSCVSDLTPKVRYATSRWNKCENATGPMGRATMRLRSHRKCEHAGTVPTVTAGIERTVCEGCGEVRISYDHRTCTTYSQGILTTRSDDFRAR